MTSQSTKTDTVPVMLIAGGTGSIGSVLAEQAARAGWAVAVHGRTEVSVDAIVKRVIEAVGTTANVQGFAIDMSVAHAATTLVERVAAWHGHINAVIDCVSTGPKARVSGAFENTEEQGYAAFMELSIVHLQRLTKAALPWLKRQGGTLVAFASDSGKFAAPNQSLIGASRAAIMGFVRNLATEVARDGVRVHCVSPSFVDETNSAMRLATINAQRVERARRKAGLGLPTPHDIAPLVLFLCGEGAQRITGQIISVNGGMNA
jgi:NAD(P)-dependent dehydrogenase (short-subunit alcohol dehydrogenase family)